MTRLASLRERPSLAAQLVDIYRLAAENAFGWAQVQRAHLAEPLPITKEGKRGAADIVLRSKQEAEEWFAKYMAVMPDTVWLASRPGLPTHLIGLAFNNMRRTPDEWEQWGYRLTAAHDFLAASLREET